MEEFEGHVLFLAGIVKLDFGRRTVPCSVFHGAEYGMARRSARGTEQRQFPSRAMEYGTGREGGVSTQYGTGEGEGSLSQGRRFKCQLKTAFLRCSPCLHSRVDQLAPCWDSPLSAGSKRLSSNSSGSDTPQNVRLSTNNQLRGKHIMDFVQHGLNHVKKLSCKRMAFPLK